MAPTGAQADPSTSEGFDIIDATIDSIHEGFASGELTCVELVQAYIDRIDEYDDPADGLGPNAIQVVNPTALATAAELDAVYASSGPAGPLHCIPTLVKDQLETFDMPTTYGSAIFEGHMTGRDATVVARLRDAGAVILAKTNMGEFAAGIYGSAFGNCRNPYDLERSPSSSSCGTGAGVAANFGAIGIAEDTGGSTRGPAAWNNTVGLRPTTPLISRFGVLPARPTDDTIGPLTRTVRDAAIVTNVIAGYDPNDPLTAYAVGNVADDYAADLGVDGLEGKRIGFIREPMANVDAAATDYAEVQGLLDQAILDMRALGAEIVDDVVIPNLSELMVGYPQETEAAINAYLASLPNPPVTTLEEIAFDPRLVPNRRNALQNAIGLSTSDYDYLAAQQVREQLRQVVLNLMAQYELDVLAYPTFSHEPTLIDGGGPAGSNRNLSPRTGFPSIAVPGGFTPGNDLPVGIDLLSRPFTESMLFEVAYAYEQGTGHRRPPAGYGAITVAPEVPTSMSDCQAGGWEAFGFPNQGQCIRFVNQR